MSFVLHDKNGYLCDLASATTCLGFTQWLKKYNISNIASDFIKDGYTPHPRRLAGEITRLLSVNPPETHVKELADAYIKGLRRAQGFAMLTQ